MSQAGRTGAKALRQDCASLGQGTAKRPVCMEQSEQGGGVREERGQGVVNPQKASKEGKDIVQLP